MFWKNDRDNNVLCKPAECNELTAWLECLVKLLDAEKSESGLEFVSAHVPSQAQIQKQKRIVDPKKKK
jgi:hypothetical protein